VPSPVAGIWATDARGLWRLDEMPAPGAEPTFREYDFVLAPTPAPESRGDEEEGVFFTVEQRKAAWCSKYEEQLAEGITRDLCFEAARGVVSGETSFAGTDTPSVQLRVEQE